MQWATDLAFTWAMATTGRAALGRLLGAAHAPETAQGNALRAILQWNAATAFGRALRFSELKKTT